MDLSHLINRPCTIVRRSESGDVDELGNDVATTTSAATVCELQQRQRSENADEITDTDWLLVLPAGTAIDTGDMVIVDGQRYEMQGDPWPVRDPWQKTVSHLEATVRRAAGQETGS